MASVGDNESTVLLDDRRLSELHSDERRGSRQTMVVGLLLVFLSIASRSATSIMTPVWLDSLNNNSNKNITDKCDAQYELPDSEHDIDPLAIMVIVNFLGVVIFGFVLLVTRILCPYLITENDRNYSKKEFALIGSSDALSGICFVFASSGCRTAPYLQSLAANFCLPVTFILRFLLLGKRPTCRKATCACLVLFAEVTALIPDMVPGLESQKARAEQGGATGIAGLLWPLCFVFGYLPLALVSVVLEKAAKTSSEVRDRSTHLNTAFMLFWCYLFSFLSLILLFWLDIIPGFGMSGGLLHFVKGFWFNIKCYFTFEAQCRGGVVVVWVTCTVLLLANRLVNTYFLRYLEGANYLVLITTVQTPLVFLFFTLFDENPVRWHPHAYLSTWMSVAALCIMIPAIYIYNTGGSEVVTKSERAVTVTNVVTSTDRGTQMNVDAGIQTDGNGRINKDGTYDRRREWQHDSSSDDETGIRADGRFQKNPPAYRNRNHFNVQTDTQIENIAALVDDRGSVDETTPLIHYRPVNSRGASPYCSITQQNNS